MQCTSFIPVYYQPRSVNGAANGFPWHLLNSNANYGDQRGFNGPLPLSTVYQYSSYDKEVMRQIIQNHEATFRYQVQELHRLYKRQKELMDETRMKEIVGQHLLSRTSESIQCLSHPRSDISQTSRTPSWLLGDHSHKKLPDLTVENNHQSLEQRKNCCNDVDFLSLRSKENGKRILDLELPADVDCADDGEQFKEGNLPDASNNLQPTCESEIGSSNSRRMNCLIDLNEPVLLESMSSNSTCAIETHNMEITLDYHPCGSEEAKPEIPTDARLDERNPSIGIDLNSMPINCFPETEATLKNLNKETTVIPDCKGVCIRDVVQDKVLETETHIDLNANAINEHLLQMPHLSEKSEEEPPLEANTIAAQTLIVISSSAIEKCMETRNPQLLGNSGNCLYWFANIVSSIADSLESDITKLQEDILLHDSGTDAAKASEKTAAGKETEGLQETGRQRRNAGKKACPKPRKCSKTVSSDAVKKSTSSIATRSRQGVLQSWGKIRKRQGGHRRRTSKLLTIN